MNDWKTLLARDTERAAETELPMTNELKWWGGFITGSSRRDAQILKLIEALELCVRRMEKTAWIEDECFEKAKETLESLRKELEG